MAETDQDIARLEAEAAARTINNAEAARAEQRAAAEDEIPDVLRNILAEPTVDFELPNDVIAMLLTGDGAAIGEKPIRIFLKDDQAGFLYAPAGEWKVYPEGDLVLFNQDDPLNPNGGGKVDIHIADAAIAVIHVILPTEEAVTGLRPVDDPEGA